MAIKYGTALRDAWNAAYEATIGSAPILQLRTGAAPASCAAADGGTLLAALTLPSDWMGDSSSGVQAKAGTWSGTAAAAGTAGHYRLKNAAGTVTHEQGAVTITGGGGDLTLDNPALEVGQTVTINAWTRTAPGA